MNDETTGGVRGGWLRAIWGALLSLIFPGLGQVYARAWRIGATVVAVNLLLELTIRGYTRLVPPTPAMVAIVIPLLAGSLLIKLFAAWDAARRIRRGTRPSRRDWRRSTWLTGALLITLTAVLALAMPLTWRGFNIPSGSDVPTLLPGDYVFVDARDPGRAPAAGDMVVFQSPRDASVDFVKRVVGLPGDRIQLTGGRLFINGQEVPREASDMIDDDSAGPAVRRKLYVETLANGRRYSIAQAAADGPLNNTQAFAVPPEHCFVLGDNRDNSADSRLLDQIGYVPIANVIGKAETIYWSSSDRSRILSRVK